MKGIQNNIIRTWLYSGLILISLMVIIGGITRLTNSGLSMVEWNLIGGAIPPLNDLQWQESFNKYKQFPEYKKINKNMQLSEYKLIFFWEYIHRLLGRIIGLVFIIPFLIFWSKKWLSKKHKKQFILLLFLGSIQGFLGWFMVKSGLVNVPAVSHFRLAIHLITAFGIMCYIYWLILNIEQEKKETNRIINKLSKYLMIAIIIQVVYGAFVAGLKAGYVLNQNNILENIFGYHFRNNNDFNLLNNSLDIQAFHRLFAWFILAITLILFFKTRYSKLAKSGSLILALTITQIILGISTLLLRVQIYFAITHQLMAIILLLCIVKIIYLSSEKSQSSV